MRAKVQERRGHSSLCSEVEATVRVSIGTGHAAHPVAVVAEGVDPSPRLQIARHSSARGVQDARCDSDRSGVDKCSGPLRQACLLALSVLCLLDALAQAFYKPDSQAEHDPGKQTFSSGWAILLND